MALETPHSPSLREEVGTEDVIPSEPLHGLSVANNPLCSRKLTHESHLLSSIVSLPYVLWRSILAIPDLDQRE